MEFVIVRQPKQGAPQFWTGESWSSEYPDAVVFAENEEKRARKEANRVARYCVPRGDVANVNLVADYGFEHEQVIQ